MRFKKGFLAIGLFLVIFPQFLFSLEPRLLWKKVLKNISTIDFAKESADIVLGFNKLERMRLISKEGITQYEWGPSEVWYLSTSISDNGRFIIYSESPKEERPKEIYAYLFSILEKKVIFRKKRGIEEGPVLSPNGEYIAYQGESGTTITNLQGKVLWYDEAMGAKFSPDSKYVVTEAPVKVYDISGKLKANLEKIFFTVGAVSINANYIAGMERLGPGIYGLREGRFIWKGESSISGDGEIIVAFEKNGLNIMKRENLQRIFSCPIITYDYINHFLHHAISFDGRIIVVHGKERNQSKIIVIDTFEKKTAEILKTMYGDQLYTTLFVTNNGKYLLVKYREDELLFYQIY